MGKHERKAELRRRIEEAVRKGQRMEDDMGEPGREESLTDTQSQSRSRVRIPRPAGTPYWVPEGPMWERLPEGVRRAVGEVLVPAFRRLVVEASDELERSAGITLAHLMWLEICDQAAMSEIVGDRKAIYAEAEEPEEAVARHLRLVVAKNSTGELLLKFRMVREALQRGERLARIPGAESALPAPPPQIENHDEGDFCPPPKGICGPEEIGIGKPPN